VDAAGLESPSYHDNDSRRHIARPSPEARRYGALDHTSNKASTKEPSQSGQRDSRSQQDEYLRSKHSSHTRRRVLHQEVLNKGGLSECPRNCIVRIAKVETGGCGCKYCDNVDPSRVRLQNGVAMPELSSGRHCFDFLQVATVVWTRKGDVYQRSREREVMSLREIGA
jgi:hypothetical protein